VLGCVIGQVKTQWNPNILMVAINPFACFRDDVIMNMDHGDRTMPCDYFVDHMSNMGYVVQSCLLGYTAV
jgi:hypothetical protein